MKRYCILFLPVILVTTLLAATPVRYYVGKTEVTRSFWDKMPDTLNYVTSEFDYDTLIVKNRELPFTHYIDSVSTPGRYVLAKRTPEVIAELERVYTEINAGRREQSLSLSEGDRTPQINLVRYNDEKAVDNFISRGECYLLSFWATWCGNCLRELKSEYLPSAIERFRDNPSFHFVPVCIDATSGDLHAFFGSRSGRHWEYLSEITFLDTNREANGQFGTGGVLPLNVVIGKDGLIRYIHSGIIKEEELPALLEAIESGLQEAGGAGDASPVSVAPPFVSFSIRFCNSNGLTYMSR